MAELRAIDYSPGRAPAIFLFDSTPWEFGEPFFAERALVIPQPSAVFGRRHLPNMSVTEQRAKGMVDHWLGTAETDALSQLAGRLDANRHHIHDNLILRVISDEDVCRWVELGHYGQLPTLSIMRVPV